MPNRDTRGADLLANLGPMHQKISVIQILKYAPWVPMSGMLLIKSTRRINAILILPAYE
jgi:hypothetical protein